MTLGDISNSLNEIVSNTFATAVTVTPRVFWAIVVAGLGWFAAWILEKITLHAIHGLDQYLERKAAQKGLRYVHIRQPLEKIIGKGVFWVSFFFFLLLAIHILRLDFLSAFFAELLKSLPMIFLGILIILLSFSVGSAIRQVVTTAFEAMEIEQAELFGGAIKLFIVVIGILLGVAQIGVDISFLATVITVSFGIVLGALGLAFGLGAQSYVANIISAAQIRKLYQKGDTVQIDSTSGKIVEIGSTVVTLQSDQGQVNMPAKIFLEKQSHLMEKEKDDAT